MGIIIFALDFPNPIYSKIRAELFEEILNVSDESFPIDSADQLILRSCKKIASSDSEVGKSAEKVLSLWQLSENQLEVKISDAVGSYLDSVNGMLKEDKGKSYFKLKTSRIADFRKSPHSFLEESAILFPKSKISLNLMMGNNGRVINK